MRSLALISVLVLVTGCGDDDEVADAASPNPDAAAVSDAAITYDAAVPDALVLPPGDAQESCPASGNAHVFGSVAGVELGPVQRVQLALAVDGFDKVVIRESGGAVCELGPALEHFLTIAFTCPPVAAGTYPVGSPSSECPAGGNEVIALFQRDGGFTLGIAEGGFVEIELVDGDCVVGTFELDFPGGDTLVGSFGAIRC